MQSIKPFVVENMLGISICTQTTDNRQRVMNHRLMQWRAAIKVALPYIDAHINQGKYKVIKA